MSQMGSDQQFCLQWHNYQESLFAFLPQLLDSNDLTDVTLSAGGRNIKAHRVILSACSLYFKELFKVLPPMQHPVIVLPGTNFTDLCALVTFMYSGEVNIYQEQLQGILTMADAMQIRGLADVNGTGDDMLKKDTQCSTLKRPRLPTHKNVCSSLLSQVFSDTNPNCGLKALQKGTSHLPGSSLVKGDFESFNEMNPSLSSRKNSAEDLISGKKKYTSKFKNGTENVEMFMGALKSEEGRPNISSDSGIMHYMDDASYSPSIPPVVISPRLFDDRRIKSEQEHREFGLGSAQDGGKSLACGNIEGQQSPSSEDSASSNFGVEILTEEGIQHNQDRNISSLKSNNTQYNKASNSLHSSKLFATCMICGKQLSNQYNLRVHMETHQNVNYSCRVCSHVSRSRDALRKHVSYRHPKEGKERIMVAGNPSRILSTGSDGKNTSSKKAKVFTNNDLTQEQP